MKRKHNSNHCTSRKHPRIQQYCIRMEEESFHTRLSISVPDNIPGFLINQFKQHEAICNTENN
jgi:hypothetical protein